MAQLKTRHSLFINSIPYAAGLACLWGIKIHGLQYQGYVWVLFLILGFFLLTTKRHHITIRFPWKTWLPWFIYVGFSLLWGSMTLRGNLQSFVQICAPFLVGLIASYTITNDDQWRTFQRGFLHALLFMFGAFLYFGYGPLGQFRGLTSFDALSYTLGEVGTLSYAARPSAMTASIIGCILLADIRRLRIYSIVGWVACLMTVLLSGSRMGTIVLLLASILSPISRSFWRRLTAVATIGALGFLLFLTPIMQARFFHSGEGRLSDVGRGEFADAGRFEYWDATIQEARERPIIGAGIGESDIFIRSIFEISQVHNDFLRIFFDLGLVGLSLFFCTICMQLFGLLRLIRSGPGESKVAATASFLGVVSWLCFSATDNPIVYNVYFTHPLFAIIGASYGLAGGRARSVAQKTQGPIPTERGIGMNRQAFR